MSAPVGMSLPSIPGVGCPGGSADPLCQVAGGAGSAIVNAGAGSVLQSLSDWVVSGAAWLLGQIGGALTSTTSIDLRAGWFSSHYQVMVALAAVVMLPLLLCGIVQAVYRQDAGTLVRGVLVHVPLALLLTAVAVQLVRLGLSVTDGLSNAVASGSGSDIQRVLSGVADSLTNQAAGGSQGPPAFVILLGAVLVAVAAFGLWLELLVRAAAVYVAVLFLPLALGSLVWPAVSHWCRKLVDTLVALILAKFVIVAVLSLAAAALASGNQQGFASILGGGALLLLAAFTPFTLLRLVPMVESSAAHQLEGARHRVRHAVESVPRSAVGYALRAVRTASWATGPVGTGLATAAEAPGPGTGPEGTGAPGGGDSDLTAGGPGVGFGLPGGEAPDPFNDPDWASRPDAFRLPPGMSLWEGDRASAEEFQRVQAETGRPFGRRGGGLFGGRGSIPVWGGGDLGLPGEAGDDPTSLGGGAGRLGRATIGHDEVGPVIRWERGGPDDQEGRGARGS